MKRISILACLSISLFASAACRGGGSGDDDDDGNTPDAPVSQKTRIQDIQNDSMPKGTAVALEGVIVTAIDAFGARTGDLWVQDPAGGEFSGVKVFGAPLDQVAMLAPGDIVNITNAEKDEFALTSDTSGRTVTEIKGAAGGMMSITKTGSGAVPAPADVDAAVIGALPTEAERFAEWEKWEGVLIKVNNVAQVTGVTSFGAAEDQFKFEADGDLVVESVLASIPATAVVGFCHASITGIGDYFFDYLLHPRDAADYAGAGTGCRTVVSTATVSDIQTGVKTGIVNVEGVFVTAIDNVGGSKGFWIADAIQGAANNGVRVFTGGTLPAGLVIGSKVDVNGMVVEFDFNPMAGDKVTEIQNVTVTVLADAPIVPVPFVADPAIVGDITNGEPFEGVFVSVSTLKVTNPALGNGKIELTANGGAKVVLDDDLFTIPAQTMNACLNVIGVMHVQLNDDIRTLLPRSAADITAGAGCL